MAIETNPKETGIKKEPRMIGHRGWRVYLIRKRLR
jgi:hypothetical protein